MEFKELARYFKGKFRITIMHAANFELMTMVD
jgi:hypothetical protein